MIVDRIDLDLAVAEGIVSREQARQLFELSHRDSDVEESRIDFTQDTQDEPFRLLRGFRDFFITVGIAIFAVGLSTAYWQTAKELPVSDEMSNTEVGIWILLMALGLCMTGLVLAEIVTRRSRLPLSSLMVAIAFAGWSANLAGLLDSPYVGGIWENSDIQADWYGTNRPVFAISGAFAALVFFYWRYRLPSALLLLAGSLLFLSFSIIRPMMGALWVADYARIFFGVWGVAIFAAAMWFDMKDRVRETRLSECAFWLHLIAAPILVHAILFGSPFDVPRLGFVLTVFLVLSFVALLIDRRALLVSGLGYFAVAIFQMVSSSSIVPGMEFAFTAFTLGAILLLLGLCWTQIRRGTLTLLPFDALKSRLPPVAA